MEFFDLIRQRESCRSYDETKPVEEEKIRRILEAAQLSPSACNGQPYHITVCQGESAKAVAKATQSLGKNDFASQAPVMIVISEDAYTKSAALGSDLSDNDYRSMDIGIVSAYITAAATELGLSTCILGWFDSKLTQEVCNLKEKVRLVITLGYANTDSIRQKRRKALDELVSYL